MESELLRPFRKKKRSGTRGRLFPQWGKNFPAGKPQKIPVELFGVILSLCLAWVNFLNWFWQ